MIPLWWLLKCKSTIYSGDLIKANNATKTSTRLILWSKMSSSQNTKVIKTSKGGIKNFEGFINVVKGFLMINQWLYLGVERPPLRKGQNTLYPSGRLECTRIGPSGLLCI